MYSFGCNHTPDTKRHMCFLTRPIKKWLIVVRVINLPVSELRVSLIAHELFTFRR